MTTNIALSPRLVVPDPDGASTFYRDALGSEEVFRAPPNEHGHPSVVIHRVGDSTFHLSPSMPEWGWLSPNELGGSPVLLEIDVDDADAFGERMTSRGAEVVIPIENRPYGKRAGRLRDPFGHLWIINGQLV